MKHIIALLIFLGGLLSVSVISAQKQSFAYVDTDYILQQIPEFRSAQKHLDDMAEQWKQEIKKREDEIDKLNKAYQAEYVVLPEDTRKKREDEITQKEKELSQYKNEKFGASGELFKKREQLLKPVQDKVFDAIQKLAKTNAYDFVFDRAGAVTMLYCNAKFDRSDDVLETLGITPDKKLKQAEKPATTPGTTNPNSKPGLNPNNPNSTPANNQYNPNTNGFPTTTPTNQNNQTNPNSTFPNNQNNQNNNNPNFPNNQNNPQTPANNPLGPH